MRVFLGVTGASGAPYAERLLRALVAVDCEVGLVASRSGIEVLAPEGGGLDDLAVKGFALPRQAPDPTGFMRTGRVVRTLTQLANDSLNATPRPAAGRCTACGNCVRACPTGAMSLRSGLAVVEKQRCIRCYCCHELCPQGAVELDISRLGRLIRGLGLM